MTNLAAFTEPGGPYPPYISINLRDGMVEITVRGRVELRQYEQNPDRHDGVCNVNGKHKVVHEYSPSATIRLEPAQARCILGEALTALDATGA
jgi:hypothetical protein